MRSNAIGLASGRRFNDKFDAKLHQIYQPKQDFLVRNPGFQCLKKRLAPQQDRQLIGMFIISRNMAILNSSDANPHQNPAMSNISGVTITGDTATVTANNARTNLWLPGKPGLLNLAIAMFSALMRKRINAVSFLSGAVFEESNLRFRSNAD